MLLITTLKGEENIGAKASHIRQEQDNFYGFTDSVDRDR
jgi:hypothetical protein